MNTKIAYGIGAVIVILVGGLLLYRPTATPSIPSPSNTFDIGQNAPTTTPRNSLPQSVTKPTSKPALKVETVSESSTASFVLFDSSSFKSTSAYPTITGTANVPRVGIIITDSKGAGIVGTSEILVTKGHWSYSISVALIPGTYTLYLFDGNISGKVKATATLTVKAP